MNRRGIISAALVLFSTIASLTISHIHAHGEDFTAAIYDACARYGCNGDQLVRVAACESGFDPYAVGPGGERGLFQFHPNGEWSYAAWYGPYEQIELAAQLFSQGRSDGWVCQ